MGSAGEYHQLDQERRVILLLETTKDTVSSIRVSETTPYSFPLSPRRCVNHTYTFPTLERSREVGWKSERLGIAPKQTVLNESFT